MSLDYKPDGRTLVEFMQSDKFVRGLQGPIGSGKSVCCVIECLRLMLAQERSIDRSTGKRTGPRKVRIGVIRNTTPQLETTTMKTWLEWMPEDAFGPMRWRAPFRQTIRIPGADVEAEVWFLALDRDEDVRKLLSFEFTFIFLNEARELTRHVVTSAISRVRRYPRMIEGGPTRACVIMDTNAPDEEHWWSIMSGQTKPPDWMSTDDRLTLVKPKNWEFFQQPPAVLDILGAAGELKGYELNPLRENAEFTASEYYTELLHGQTRDWIVNMLQNKIGTIFSGRPVYQGFHGETHIAKEVLHPVQGIPIHVGVDFGTTPAASFSQDVFGQWRTIDELVSRDTHIKDFAKALLKKINEQYDGYEILFTGDPNGDNATGVDDLTPFRVLKSEGINIKPSWSNDPVIRIGAIQTQINTMVDGRPAYVASPACTYLNKGKKGGYCYKPDQEKVDKDNIYSHVSDAEQYGALGAGYGKRLIGAGQMKHVQKQANRNQDLFNRGGLTARQRTQQSILSRGRRG